MSRNGIVQWGWSDFEELLQCPVCLDIPAAGPGLTVEQCIHGHHICHPCKLQVENCPLCKCSFHGTRNFVVEELVRHFEILKNTMLLNNVVIESKPKKKKIKVSVRAPEFEIVRRSVNTPSVDRGLYPCRVDDCTAVLPAARLLNHIRSFHPSNLTESVVDLTDSYIQTWEVSHINKKPINKTSFVVFVSGIGLIFLNIEILRTGQLIATVRASMKLAQAQNFLACVEFYSGSTSYSYNSRLISVRDNIIHMLQAKTCFILNKAQLKRLCRDRKFNCKLRLSRYNDVDFNLLTTPDAEAIAYIAGVRASLMDQDNKKNVKTGNKSNNTIPQASSSSINGISLDDILNETFHKTINELLKDMQAREANLSKMVMAPTSTTGAKKNSKNKKKKR